MIVSARTAAAFMMSIIFRGYTVWVINVILCIYFFTQTFKISDYNRIKVGTHTHTNIELRISQRLNILFNEFQEAILNQSLTSNGTLQKKVQQHSSPHRVKFVYIKKMKKKLTDQNSK